MPLKESSDLTPANLLALRDQPNALKIIVERLMVRQMGPADHIRTKHEIKALIESGGDVKDAEAIIERAKARRAVEQAHNLKISQRQERRLSQ